MRWCGLLDSELSAGAAFVPAGYSSGRGDCARISDGEMVQFYCRVLRQITPAVCCMAPNRTACDMLRSYSAWVGIASRAFSNAVRLLGLVGSLWACAFRYGDSDGVTTGVYTKRNAAMDGVPFDMDYFLQ